MGINNKYSREDRIKSYEIMRLKRKQKEIYELWHRIETKIEHIKQEIGEGLIRKGDTKK